MTNEYPTENDIRVLDWIKPVKGFIDYVRRNVNAKTTDTNQYVNGFYHLLLVQIGECAAWGILITKGLEKILT